MTVPKPPTGTYSAALRARRLARIQPRRSGAPRIDALQIGNWVLTDEAGAFVIINQTTGAHVVLVKGGDTE
jgi:hypothetical protein